MNRALSINDAKIFGDGGGMVCGKCVGIYICSREAASEDSEILILSR